MYGIRKNSQVRPPGVKQAAVYSIFINILIYLLFFVMFVYGRSAVLPNEGGPHPHPPMTGVVLLIGVVSTYLFVFILFCINFYILKSEKLSGGGKLAVSLLASLVYIILWNRLTMATQVAFFDMPQPSQRALRGSIMRDIVLGGLTVLTSQIMYANYRRQLIAIENEALKAEYERARYATLKSQIDPHFLFNTLNTLNSIVGKDPKSAQRYIQKLSSIFRYTMQNKDVTTLEDELAFTRDYCDLMQIRYGENLEFVFDVDRKYDSYTVVPFSIQTLVENAIKHNVITSKHKLAIVISTGGDNFLTVSNRINPKKDEESGEGIGLANLSERYMLKWGVDIVINNDGQTFSVSIPLIPTNADNNRSEK